MTAWRLSLWRKVAALAPVLLLLVYLPGQAMLRCRLDGQLREVCCCPPDDGRDERSADPVLRAQDCCDRQDTHTARPAAEVVRDSSGDSAAVAYPAVVAVAPIPLLTSRGERFGGAAQRHGPAHDGPPIVLLKHAFLI